MSLEHWNNAKYTGFNRSYSLLKKTTGISSIIIEIWSIYLHGTKDCQQLFTFQANTMSIPIKSKDCLVFG